MGDEKAALRRRIRVRLRTIPSREADEAGRVVATRLEGSDAWRAARTVALFASLPGEISTAPLIDRAWREGRRVLLPRVDDGGGLVFAEHAPAGELITGRFGVREPASSAPPIALVEADLVVVPGLAFDRGGGRLGRGAGYYDRVLAAARPGVEPGSDPRTDRAPDSPWTIGVGFGFQLVASVPMGPLDVRLDAVVTDAEEVGVESIRAGRADEDGIG